MFFPLIVVNYARIWSGILEFNKLYVFVAAPANDMLVGILVYEAGALE